MALRRFLVNTDKEKPKICILKSLNPLYPDIKLCNDTPVTIGRCIDTKINDVNVSRRQLLVKANFNYNTLLIKVCGINASGVNGFLMKQGRVCEAHHGDILELLHERYPYKVTFPFQEEYIKGHVVNLTNCDNNDGNDTSNSNDNDNGDHQCSEAKKMKLVANTDEPQGKWECVADGKLLVYMSADSPNSEKVAAFDLDGTLITTISEKAFPKDIHDWKLFHPSIPDKLSTYADRNYKILIFTNQLLISKGDLTIENFKLKISAILKRLKIPVQIFVATSRSIFRKPLPGMWNYFANTCNGDKIVKLKESFYVGDAAGRPANLILGKKRKDHSLSDRLFAINIGIPFMTPEEFFLNAVKMEYKRPNFDPKHFTPSSVLYEPIATRVPLKEREIIVLVGLPGSGKSYFAASELQKLNYTIINRDVMKSMPACLSACGKALEQGKSCAIDNTNVDEISRKPFLCLAEKYHVKCRAFVMKISIDHIRHNIAFRELTDKTHAKINELVLNTLKKKYTPPTLDEGFSEIVQVHFIPKFKNSEQFNLYRMFLVDK